MLTIKCAKCKSKIIKYNKLALPSYFKCKFLDVIIHDIKKIGTGKVLRCWKSKIKRVYDGEVQDDNLVCSNCGNIIGEVEDDYVKMNRDAFTYTGTKIKK